MAVRIVNQIFVEFQKLFSAFIIDDLILIVSMVALRCTRSVFRSIGGLRRQPRVPKYCAAVVAVQQPARHFNLHEYQSKQLIKKYNIRVQRMRNNVLRPVQQSVGQVVLTAQILAPEAFTVDDDG